MDMSEIADTQTFGQIAIVHKVKVGHLHDKTLVGYTVMGLKTSIASSIVPAATEVKNITLIAVGLGL